MSKITLASLANLQNETTAVNTINSNSSIVQTAWDNTLSRDGTSPNTMGASFDMNSNRILNLPQPVSLLEPLRLTDLNTFIGGGSITTLPTGGTTGQILGKTSNTDFAVAWINAISAASNNTFTGNNTFTLPVIAGTIVGGTTASSTLTLESTSGVGTTDAIIFKTGSQVEAARFNTSGGFSVGLTNDAGVGGVFVKNSLAVGLTGSVTGQLNMVGATSGFASVRSQAIAGTPILTLPNASGTFAVSVTGPLTLSSTTGNITVTGSALTEVDDTNVTLTLGGTPGSALLTATSMTLGWTGQLAVSRGGTGSTSLSAFTVLCGGTTTTNPVQSVSGLGSLAQVLTSNGPGTLPSWQNATGGSGGTPASPQGRLTLTTATAITTSDVSGATTLYYTPSTAGSYVPITTDGSTFTMTAFTELSQLTTDTTKSPAAVASSSVYDIFVWSDSGTLRATRGPAWTSDTVRGTGAGTSEIDFTTKFPTNKNSITNGPAANRGVLVGSIRSTAASQLVDSKLFRWVSNIYNTVPRSMRVFETTDQWLGANAATYRQANASTANQLDWLQSLAGGMTEVSVNAVGSNVTTGKIMVVGVGLDRVNGNDADCWGLHNSAVTNAVLPCAASYRGYVGLGRHFAAWVEYDASAGTATWYGDIGAPGVVQSGITGWINN